MINSIQVPNYFQPRFTPSYWELAAVTFEIVPWIPGNSHSHADQLMTCHIRPGTAVFLWSKENARKREFLCVVGLIFGARSR